MEIWSPVPVSYQPQTSLSFRMSLYICHGRSQPGSSGASGGRESAKCPFPVIPSSQPAVIKLRFLDIKNGNRV